ncbi:MAG: deoxyguanosinetriphosphate triphosphohydrolase [Chloroflexi bacterium]|nr:deoxyguanosinetriphosphate triphosphohydrolase [Chloroflexota bacterium]
MLATREYLETIELEHLAPYAQLSKHTHTRGRVHPEPEHAYRTAFQRDRDRVLHTTAFRRLEYKTQVFVNYEGDHYRTRLTHTLEVSQIARTLARVLLVNEDLTEAIALAHDLGHTPFGHAGERTLHDKMLDFGGFNHNTHGLRIVEELEDRYPSFHGLNLTWEVREGIIKHATEYDTPQAVDYEPQLRSSLEGQIINTADEIAYNTHDLDDGLRSGLISPQQLLDVELWREALRELQLDSNSLSSLDRNRIIHYLINREVTDVVQATERGLQQSQVNSPDEVRAAPQDLVVFSEAQSALNRELRDFLYRNLYRNWRVMRMTAKVTHMVGELFDYFVEHPELLPPEHQLRAKDLPIQRVVCDYIAGMTDRYALQEYRRLLDPEEKG